MAVLNRFTTEATEDSPGIVLDHEKGFIRFSGRSIPNDADKIYGPVIFWMKQYITQPAQLTTLECELDYFNTSSQKYLADVFKMVNRLYLDGKAVQCIWMYRDDDEDMMHIGEQFEYLLDFKITFVAI
ncbi:MAG: DUF1987 domain-containing protein [Bacteroidota bacterium]|jgi:hypothetical protein